MWPAKSQKWYMGIDDYYGTIKKKLGQTSVKLLHNHYFYISFIELVAS